MNLHKDLTHINFNDPHVIEMLHLSAYAAYCISRLQPTGGWVGGVNKEYGNDVITYHEFSCSRHPLQLVEYSYDRDCYKVIAQKMIEKDILKKGLTIPQKNTYPPHQVLQTYVLVDTGKSRQIAIKYARKPPKAFYRTAGHNQTGVPIHATPPEYAVHIFEHQDEYEEVEKGYFRDKSKHDEGVKEQARKYLRQYMGTSFCDLIKDLKGDDLMRHNLTQILELMKKNAPLLINERRYEQFAKFTIKNLDILDYDTLYGSK